MDSFDVRYGIVIAAIEAGHELDQIVPFAERATAFVRGETQISGTPWAGSRVQIDLPEEQPKPEPESAPSADAEPPPEPAPEQDCAAPAVSDSPREGLPYRLYRVLQAAHEGGDAAAIAARLGLRQGSVKIYLAELRGLGKLPPADLAEAGRALSALKKTGAEEEAVSAPRQSPNGLAIPLLQGISTEDSQIVYLRKSGWNPKELAGRFSRTIPEMNQILRRLERDGHLPEAAE